MLLRMGFGRKLVTQISRFIPTQTPRQSAKTYDTAAQQALYESIAVGNALADAEEMANRYWRGS